MLEDPYGIVEYTLSDHSVSFLEAEKGLSTSTDDGSAVSEAELASG